MRKGSTGAFIPAKMCHLELRITRMPHKALDRVEHAFVTPVRPRLLACRFAKEHTKKETALVCHFACGFSGGDLEVKMLPEEQLQSLR